RGYSTAAISRQIGELQRRLGFRLFEPAGRSIRPSDEALELAARARPLLAEADHFEAFVRRTSFTGLLT
ncbi:LysR family transcriptional regulator, partial [Streptomyces albidoflavus]